MAKFWLVGNSESAVLNRPVVGDERALQERRAANPSWLRGAPGELRCAIACNGGQRIVGVAGDHDLCEWSLPSGARRAVSLADGRISLAACGEALAIGYKEGTVKFAVAGAEGMLFADFLSILPVRCHATQSCWRWGRARQGCYSFGKKGTDKSVWIS